MPKTWFTSDLHLGHSKIIEYCDRPYSDVKEMNKSLVDNWNTCVKPDDVVYFLGDFAMSGRDNIHLWLNFLNGRKHLIKGNHDYSVKWDKFPQWESVSNLKEISLSSEGENYKIIMCHFPLLTWNKSHYGSWMLHGHAHASLPFDPNIKRLDVGVDGHDYKPVSFEQVKEIFNNKEFTYK